MSQAVCECNGAPLNSGLSCVEQIKTWDYIVVVDYKDSTGAVNSIPKGTVIDATYVSDKLNNIDPTIRWTVFPKLWAVEDVRGDALTESIDNVDFVEEQGTRTFVGSHIGKFGSPEMVKTWNSRKCRNNAMFGLTSAGQIVGTNPDATVGDLNPIRIQNDTLIATYVKPTKAPTKQKCQVNFAVDQTESDDCLDFISSSNIAYGTANWYSDAPIDVIGSGTSGALTEIVVNLSERMGSVNKNAITGLVAADFSWDNGVTPSSFYNTTTSSSVAIVTAVETVGTPGEYTLTCVAQTASDVASVDIFKTGLDMINPIEVTF